MEDEIGPGDWTVAIEVWAHLTLKELADARRISDTERRMLLALDARAASRRSLIEERFGRPDRRVVTDRRAASQGEGLAQELLSQLRALVAKAAGIIEAQEAMGETLDVDLQAEVRGLLEVGLAASQLPH